MSEDPVVSLRDLSQPDSSRPESPQRSGELLSSGPGWVELELTEDGAPLSGGTPVAVRTSETIYMGHIESGKMQDNRDCLRVRVDHWLAVQDVSAIQKLWSQEQPD